VCAGSYGPGMGGRGAGIYLFWQGRPGVLTPAGAVAMAAPSWLCWHPRLPVLYAADEQEGTVSALVLGPDGSSGQDLLRVVDRLPSGGREPCHLAVCGKGEYLACANYGNGSVSIFRLDPAGRLVERTWLAEHHGSGPDPERQDRAHPHMVVPTADGSGLSVVDLGTDEVRSYQLSAEGSLGPLATSTLPSGSGPRQLVRVPGSRRVLIVAELTSALIVAEEAEDGAIVVTGTLAATAASRGEGSPRNFPSQATLSTDHRLLYLSNRGTDTIAVFATDDLGRTGEYPSGGQWPRHFALDGPYLYVANQLDDTLAIFDTDPVTGALSLISTYAVGSPACVAVR
jgi:6-phosphogluconolactonase